MSETGQANEADFPYRGASRGSQWAKWDLHVHTPASVIHDFGDNQDPATWEEYIQALEALPPQIKVVGINDYFFLEGYSHVIAAKESGRLSNIDLILPVVELRLSSFAGHRELRKINFHVVFSDELQPRQIELFFLRKLGVEFKLGDGSTWRGDVCHREGLIELGKAIKWSTPESKRPTESDLYVGFCNAAFSLEQVRDAVNQTMFEGKAITAVGLAEWDQMRWDGGSAAIKKDIINGADLVFTASHSVTHFRERLRQLRSQEVNTRLLDCSDAHFYASSNQPNRLGNVLTWLKADCTFQGLRRVIQCFEDRVFIGEVGDMPPKLCLVRENRVRYIQAIEIRKKHGSDLEEVWFDCAIPINHDLVAIIGNQGNGKSALTDVIALCGNTKASEFSFLNSDKFCDKENKAGQFEATLTWEDGTLAKRSLDSGVDQTAYERVRYVPQGFFEAVTNETVVREGGRFYTEIKKVVYSHIDESDRLGFDNLDALVEFHTAEISQGLAVLRQDLADLNSRIAAVEREVAPLEIERLKREMEEREKEIVAHRLLEPDKVEKPSESEETNNKVEELRNEEQHILATVETIHQQLTLLKKQRAFLIQKQQAIENEKRRVDSFLGRLKEDLVNEGLDIVVDQLIWIGIDVAPLTTAIGDIQNTIDDLEAQIDPEWDSSLIRQAETTHKQRKLLESELQQVSQAYQNYRSELSSWQEGLTRLRDEMQRLEQRVHGITVDKPLELTQLQNERQEKCKEIHKELKRLASVYEELTRPVQAHIATDPLTKDKFRIEFAIKLVERDIVDWLFGIIGQGTGTFSGVQEGRERLQTIAGRYDFASAESVVDFAEKVLDNLRNNYKNAPSTPVELARLLRKGHKVEDIYDLLFGLEYVYPQYSLALNGKPLRQLSPGERGILLLVFYLIVDRGVEPLIIDQPEGNLNNQSIFHNLVPVFKKAKNRRQIIVVTHNPNLAVVCDAEQIIHAEINIQNGNHVAFKSGALENPIFNRLSLDVLEGTPPAFDARRMTYESIGR